VLGNTGSLVKTGYTFAGWTIGTSGSTVYKPGTANTTFAISENTTLYAKWLTAAETLATNLGGDTKATVNGATVTLTTNVDLSSPVTVLAGVTLDVGNYTLTIGTSGSLVLTGDASNGAQISGTGKVVAAKTEITGIWQAVGSGDVTIAASSTTESSITASADTVVLTAGTGGIITQLAEASNNLTIAANTTIDLQGTESAAVGKLILTGDGTNPAEIKLANAATSIVKTGLTAGTNAFSAATQIGTKTFAAGTTGAAVITTNVDGATGKFATLTAGTDNFGLKGGDSSNTITIDSTQDVAS
jgi:uncharacterized repeat protein (TIGR02543 family)